MKLSKLRVALIGGAAALAASYAVAQVTLPIVATLNAGDYLGVVPLGFPSSQGQFATMTQVRTTAMAQAGGHGGTPTLTTSGSGCGGNTAVIDGTDVSGQVAQGSSNAVTCVMTFSKAYNTAPECFVSINGVADNSLKCATNATAATVTETNSTNEVLNYEIVGLPGG